MCLQMDHNLIRSFFYLFFLAQVYYFLGHLLLTCGASFVVSLALEVPFLMLERVLIPKAR